MTSSMLISNLKALKRTAKEMPEYGRSVCGAISRLVKSDNPDDRVGVEQEFKSRDYETSNKKWKVTIVTPSDGHYMTTFFDVPALSPSGRLLAVTKVPFINRIPIPGDSAEVCVIDLLKKKCKTVFITQGWGSQLGANVQWGVDDNTIYCNVVHNGRATGVRVSVDSCRDIILDGPIYGLTPDRKYSYSGDLQHINGIIPGYGVPDPILGKRRQTDLMSAHNGIWRTDLISAKSELFISIQDLVKNLPDQESVRGGIYNIFNVKVSPDGSRLFAVVFSRKIPYRAGWAVQLVTLKADGTDIRLAMPDSRWRVGGHHPNWMPDSEHILMNLRSPGERMAFVRFKFDGTDLQRIAPGHVGSGHPSVSPDGRVLLSDAYISEGFSDSKGYVPIRAIDLTSNEESEICRVFTKRLEGPRRVDPHPVWSKCGHKVVFNAVVNDCRQVMLAERIG